MIHPSRRAFLKTLLSLPIAVHMDVEALLWTPSPIVVVPAMPQKFVVGAGMKELIRLSMLQRDFFERTFEDMDKFELIRTGRLTTINGGLRL